MLPSLIVLAVVVLVAALAIASLWRGHRSGKSSCGGDCSHCKGCH